MSRAQRTFPHGRCHRVQRFGRLDVPFNIAAVEFINGKKIIAYTEQTKFDDFMARNVGGTFNLMKHEIPAMLASGGGDIVNMASIAGQRPDNNVSNIYCATRNAIIGVKTNAARDWAPKGIRINAVLIGVILSRPDLPRLADQHNFSSRCTRQRGWGCRRKWLVPCCGYVPNMHSATSARSGTSMADSA